MTTTRGKFIVFEGIDGAGTTTQLDPVLAFLESKGRKAIATHEPSEGPVGLLIREILLGKHKNVPEGAMALLFSADRVDHLSKVVERALSLGIDVVCDRYVWSSIAYQSLKLDENWVRSLNNNFPIPDLTIFFDLPLEVARSRRTKALRPEERYDADATLKHVRDVYLNLFNQTRALQTVVCVDASKSVDEVTKEVCDQIQLHL